MIEGDQATDNDARRIEAAGAPAVQINTGAGCHLDASMVAGGLRRLDPPPGSVVFIENVGNLVCPALFDLGEAEKVVVCSVTEGDDKPLKYPHMFRACRRHAAQQGRPAALRASSTWGGASRTPCRVNPVARGDPGLRDPRRRPGPWYDRIRRLAVRRPPATLARRI